MAAQVLERSVAFFVGSDKFRQTVRQSVLDYLLPGRGTVWVRYVPHFRDLALQTGTGTSPDVAADGAQATDDLDEEAPKPQEVAYEEAVTDYVHWDDFGHTVVRTWEEVGAAWQRIKRSLIDALDDDVIETAAGDAFRPARDAARRRFEEFAPKTLKNVVDEKTVADDVLKRNVLGAKVADLEAFKRSLTSGTDDQVQRGQQAWDDLRLQTLEHVIKQSTDAGGKLQGSRLSKALDAIGNERLRIIFSPEELTQLGAIGRAAYNTTVAVPESRVNYSGTGAFLADLLGRMGVGKNVQRAAQAVTNLPVIGPIAAPVAGIANATGKVIDEAAVNAAVGKALNASPEAVADVMKRAGYREKVIEYLQTLPPSPATAEALNMLSQDRDVGDGSGRPLRIDIGAPPGWPG